MRLQARNPSVAESILDAQQILITGPPGTGKTTLAHTITQWRQLQFRGARRTVFDPTFSWNQHIWLQSVSLAELHQERFVAGGGGQFHARFWDTFKVLDVHPQDALHTLVFDEICQWPTLGFTREELSLLAEFTLKARRHHLASIVIAPSVAFASTLHALYGAGLLSPTHRQQAVVLELLPHENPHGVIVPSITALYSPEGCSTQTEIALSDILLAIH